MGRNAVEKLAEKMRKNSFANLALLLGGIFVLGIGLSHTLWLQKSASKSLAGADAVNTLSPESAPVIVPKETTSTRSSLAKVPPATLDIEVEHNFTQAQLSVWVDDHSIHTHPLEGTDKKRLVVFHGVQGHQSHVMHLAPGEHRVRVWVVSGVDSYDQSGTVAGEFVSGKEKVLRIHFNKRGEMNLRLQ